MRGAPRKAAPERSGAVLFIPLPCRPKAFSTEKGIGKRLPEPAATAFGDLSETSISFCWQASRKPFLRLRKATPAVECSRNFEIPVSSFRGRSRLNVTVRTKCARQTSSIALRIGIKSFCLIVGVRRQCRASFRSVRHHTSMCWSRPLPQTEVSVTSFHKKW